MADGRADGPGPRPARGMLGRAELWLVGVVLASALGFLAAGAWAGLDRVAALLSAFDARLILTLLALSLVNYALRGARWILFARALGLGVGSGRLGLHYVAGFAATPTPGKAGELLRLWFLRRDHGLSYGRTLGLALMDRIADALILGSIAVAGLGAGGGAPALIPALGLCALAITGLALPRLSLALVTWTYGRIGRGRRLFARLRHLLRRAAPLARPVTLGPALILTAGGWLAEIHAFALVLDRLGHAGPLARAGEVFAIGTIAGAVTLTPGGVGGAEAAMVALLAHDGLNFDAALTATLVIRATTLWFGVGLGWIALPLALRRPRG